MGKIKDMVIKAEDKAKGIIDTVEADVKYVNSAFLEFPTDVHNLTGDLKKVMLSLASRINGADDKYKVFKNTLETLLKHVEARFIEASNATKARVAEAKAKSEAIETIVKK